MRLAIIFAIFTYLFRVAEGTHRLFTRGGNQKFYGYASWYGLEEVGNPTASGERFNPAKLTAAHRRFPFGTYVRVTRLDSGKSVVVRINDRGPFRWRRIIDLSPAAAQQLDMLEIGVTRVCVEVLGDHPPDTPPTTP